MKQKLLFSLGLFFSFHTSWAQHEAIMFFPIQEIWETEAGKTIAQIEVYPGMSWVQDAPADIMGLWSEEDPDHANSLGEAQMYENNGQTVSFEIPSEESIQMGDLIEGRVSLPGPEVSNLLYKLMCQDIWLLDVFGKPFCSAADLITESREGHIEQILDTMVRDIRFVADAMEEQGMEDQMIENGVYNEQWLFEVMRAADQEELESFLGFVQYRPGKYRGHDWKVSEIFATWLVNGAPSATDMLVMDITASIETERREAGLPDCEGEALTLDLKKGQLNGLKPTASPETVKERFPCFTGESEEGMVGNCGGGIFFLKHDMYFYTHRDYLEVRTDFAGEISEPLLGKSMEEVQAHLGTADYIPVYESQEEDSWFSFEPDIHHLYKRKYGALRITYNPKSKIVEKIGVHFQKPREINICW